MADYNRRWEQARDQLREHHDEGIIDTSDYEAIQEFLRVYDPDKHRHKPPEDDKTKSKGTLARWARQLDQLCRFTDKSLLNQSANDVNELMDDLYDGTHDESPDGGYAHSTVRQFQLTARKFYRYTGTFDESEIYVLPMPDTSVDKADMFEWDEIEAMRDVIDNARDQAMFDLFLYTGQRLTAIQTLRVKDVNVDEGTFRLNPIVPGLKSAEGYRPLLGAQASVRDWLQKHPASDDPEAYLLTHLPSWNRSGSGEMLSENTIRRTFQKIRERADIEKPMNPHNFRHNFVTIAYLEYDMDKDTIRHLIGHGPGSKVMETTYAHLDDEDYIKDAERAFGVRDEESESRLTPGQCPTCNAALSPSAKACSNCGLVFTPDAQAVRKKLDEDMYKSAKQADSEKLREALDTFREILDENPEYLEELAEGS